MGSLRLRKKVSLCHFLETDTVLLKQKTWHCPGVTHSILYWQFISSPANPLTLLPLKRHQLFPLLTFAIPQTHEPIPSA